MSFFNTCISLILNKILDLYITDGVTCTYIPKSNVMKRYVFFLVLISFFTCSYSQHEAVQLTAEQKVTIEKEVSEQLDKHLESLSSLDYELWLECISKDNFIPGFWSGVVGTYANYDSFVGGVKDSFANRESQKFENLKVQITPLSPELAFLTFTGLFENWTRDGHYHKDFINAIVLWKKEADAWKIIHLNEAWIPVYPSPSSSY